SRSWPCSGRRARDAPVRCRAFRARYRRSAASWRPGRFRCRISDWRAARRRSGPWRRWLGSGSYEPRCGVELGGGGEFPGRDLGAGRALGAVVGLHAQILDAAVGADDGEAVGSDLGDLAHLAADALGVARGQGLGLERLQRLALERRPRAGRRIAAADEIVDLAPGLAPVDAGIVAPAAALIGCLRVILLDARRLAGFDQVDRFQHRLD